MPKIIFFKNYYLGYPVEMITFLINNEMKFCSITLMLYLFLDTVKNHSPDNSIWKTYLFSKAGNALCKGP